MGKPAARITDMHTCPMITPGVPPIPHVGGPVTGPGVPTVLIGGMPAAVMGDMCVCVGPPDTIILGSTGVLIGGKPAARMGDTTAHGGVIMGGLPTVLIGDVGVGEVWVMPVGAILINAEVEKIVTPNGVKITGFTDHGLERLYGNENRMAVHIDSVSDALKNPLAINDPAVDKNGRTSQRFIGKKAEVVVNPKTGKIVSVNPTSSKKANKLILKQKK
ncbi:MAG TPA: PAAR domain-containing protein [Mucilaginibacter sp.]|nr:PAAR domain-containing protein [Mucilaginibacter sp.]